MSREYTLSALEDDLVTQLVKAVRDGPPHGAGTARCLG